MILLLYLALYAILILVVAIWYWATKTPVIALQKSLSYNHSYIDPLRTAGLEQPDLLNPQTLPVWLPLAILLTEDPGFFEHRGFSFSEMRRRLWAYFFKRGPRGSGSTISQQLIKFFFTFAEPTPLRKLKEAILTMRLEKHFTKLEILSLYVSNAPLGRDIFGVEAASRYYFDKSAVDCEIFEAALLAIFLRKPQQLGTQFLHGALPHSLQQELYEKIQHIHLILMLTEIAPFPSVNSSSSDLDIQRPIKQYHRLFPSLTLSNMAGREASSRSLDSFSSFIRSYSKYIPGVR